MKKVLNIVPYPYLPFFSGGQKLIAHFNAYLSEQCVLHVAGTSNNDQSLVTNYSFHPVLGNSKLRYANPFVFYQLKRIINDQEIETVIIEHPYLGWLGWMLKKFCGIKLIVHTHNIEYERFRTIGKPWWPLLKLYEGFVLRMADNVFCISDEDRQWMISKMKVKAGNCTVVPYGIVNDQIPTDRPYCKEQVCIRHDIDKTKTLLFFNGLLDYKPNTDALRTIIADLNPLLLRSNLNYHILVAGKRLPASFDGLKQWNKVNISYAGFVDDIDFYTKAADILLNPVTTGGGVKTKMIEALGLNTSVVATETGAIGVDTTVCGNKLKLVPDGSWDQFVEALVYFTKNPQIKTPDSFYSCYHWQEIIKKVVPFFEAP